MKPQEEPRFRLRGVGVRYAGRPALRGVDLDIPSTGITAIVGPSGCGKSTLLATLNRLTDLIPGCQVEGEVRVDGIDVRSRACDVLELRRHVGMVFQRPHPFPLSIAQNLSLPLREYGVPADEIAARSEEALRDVGLWSEVEDRLDRSALALSGGQQQRLCLARALALRPRAILFDEPCSALDPISSAVVEDLVCALRGRVTTVIVTHNLAQARRVADRLAVLWVRDGAGTVLAAGPARELFERTEDETVRDYLQGSRG